MTGLTDFVEMVTTLISNMSSKVVTGNTMYIWLYSLQMVRAQ